MQGNCGVCELCCIAVAVYRNCLSRICGVGLLQCRRIVVYSSSGIREPLC